MFRPLLRAALRTVAPLVAASAMAAEPFVAILPDGESPKDLQQSFDSFAEYLRQAGIGDYEPRVFAKLAEAEAFLKERRASGKPVALGVVPALLLVKRADWGFVPVACPTAGGSTMARHVLVAPRSSPATGVKDLQGKRLAAPRIWTETPDLMGLLLFQDATKPQTFFGTVMPLDETASVFPALMRRDVDAALMSRAVFEAAQKRNREVWKDLKIVAELPEVHYAPVVAARDAPAEMVAKLEAALAGATASDAGKKLLGHLHVDGFQKCAAADLDAVEGKLVAKLGTPAGAPAAAPGAAAAAGAPAAPPESDGLAGDAEDVSVKSIEVERDGDTGDIIAVVKLGAKAPAGMKARVSLDGGPDRELPLECEQDLCVLTLPAADAAGKGKMALQVVIDRDGKLLRVGKRKSYGIGG